VALTPLVLTEHLAVVALEALVFHPQLLELL
jgi:hypothetical protein